MENKIYNEVPNILTNKDLDYLSDMYNWNYLALKKINIAKEKVQTEEIKDQLTKGYQLFQDNLNQVLTILNEEANNE